MNILRYAVCISGALLLASCAPHGGLLKSDTNVQKTSSTSAKKLQGMAKVSHDFYAGKVMESYQAAKAISPQDKEYAQARLFLKKTINPARIRLLRYYKKLAIQAKRAKKWHAAWVNYRQAAEFSAQPKVFAADIHAMFLHREQVRLNTLLKQRREEDHALLQGLTAYTPPKGVSKHDAVFLDFAKRHRSMLEKRANAAYTQANQYVQKQQMLPAYVLIESHLRLMPDSTRGEKLLASIQKSWLKGLRIGKITSSKHKQVNNKKKRKTSTSSQPEKNEKATEDVVLSKDAIQSLMQQKRWLEAKDAALVYQQHDGEDAKALLQSIDDNMQQAAKQAFQQGSIAFQKEHIDQAVRLWEKAVELDSQNEMYLDAWMRASSLQERLHLLRKKK